MALLEVRGLSKWFAVRGQGLRRQWLKAVDGVDFDIEAGRTLGLVGESGCGKSTLGRAVLRLHEPTAGTVRLDGRPVTGLGAAALRARRREMQIVFQDPYASLNPRRSIGQTLTEPLAVHGIGDAASRRRRAAELLDLVGLREDALARYPHEFSGGQRQRIGIARALALEPRFIVADEAVSALDVSVQAQVLNLMHDIQQRLGVAYLFISHDLAVVQHVADEVGVMYLGRIVEQAPAARLYRQPQHPYTQALLAAVPLPAPGRRQRPPPLAGDLPSPLAPPAGCAFRSRCPAAHARCASESPVLRDIDGNGHRVACHLLDTPP